MEHKSFFYNYLETFCFQRTLRTLPKIGTVHSNARAEFRGNQVSLSISRQLVVAPGGQAAFATTVTTFNGQMFNSATTKGYGGYAGIQFSVSNASNVNDLGGSSLDYGLGGGDGWGGGFDFSTDLQTWQATGTVGVGFGGYGHWLTNVTTSMTPICGG